MHSPSRTLSCLALVLSVAGLAAAQDINVDVGAEFGPPSTAFGGAAGQPGFWNEVGSLGAHGVLDVSGEATSVTVTLLSESAEGWAGDGAGDLAKLIGDNSLDCVDPDEWKVTFDGLADGTYQVYLYAPFNNSVGTGDMMVGDTSVSEIHGAGAPLQEGVNWVQATVGVTGGELEIEGQEGDAGCVGIAGIQLNLLGSEPPLGDCAVGTCVENATTMCLAGGRFRVTAEFDPVNDGDDIMDPAHMVRLTGDSGYTWFLRDSNIEAVIKVLDACSFADRFWVFAGGLTNVNTVIRVCDTQEGVEKVYVNPQETPFEPIQDVNAFATCE